MGANIRLRTLWDLLHHGYQLRVTCLGCGRSGVYATVSVLDWFTLTARRRSRNPALEVAGSYFRCEGCGHRGARLAPVAPYRVPDLPRLEPSRYELKERARRERG